MNYLMALTLCAALLTGCGKQYSDNAEENNPHIRKGLEQLQLKQWDSAISQFQTALKNNMDLARPNLELALIYHQQKKDYVRAIYHYKTYLDKRPNTEKKPIIQEWIQHAELSLTAEIEQHTPSNSEKISEELVRLKRENNLLRKQLNEAISAAEVISAPVQQAPQIATPTPTPISSTPVSQVQTPTPTSETYTVLPGDTLSKIARTVYGDSSKWREIYGVNMDKMKNENDLKVGQIITIPAPEN